MESHPDNLIARPLAPLNFQFLFGWKGSLRLQLSCAFSGNKRLPACRPTMVHEGLLRRKSLEPVFRWVPAASMGQAPFLRGQISRVLRATTAFAVILHRQASLRQYRLPISTAPFSSYATTRAGGCALGAPLGKACRAGRARS